MPDSCRPPPGTKRGTFHWLRRDCGMWIVAEWRDENDLWESAGFIEWESPRRLSADAWHYVGPYEAPEEPPR